MKLRMIGYVIAAMLLAAPPGAVQGAKRRLIDRAAILVNNKIVTMQEVNSGINLQEKDIRRRYKGQELAKRLKNLERAVVEGMIESLLLEARAEELGVQVTEQEIENRVDLIVQRDPRITRVYSDSALKEFVVKDILRKRVIQREVVTRLVVGQDAIKAACLEESGASREVDVGHILLRGDSEDTKARILDIRRQLKAGADFSEVAVRHSQDPQAKANKGRLGFISRGQFFKPFEDAAYLLKAGELSGPVKTKFGYHLIMVYGERSRSEVDCDRLEPQVHRRIKDKLWGAQREKQMKKFLTELRNNAEIVIFDRNDSVSR